MISFFFDKEKRVLSWLNRFPPEMHEFIKEVVVYNALTHPDKASLLRLPFFEEEALQAPLITTGHQPQPAVAQHVTPPPTDDPVQFMQAPPDSHDQDNINSWFNM